MADETESFETVKYYTRARKFPQLLGRMPDGTKIPGGPYTVQQLLAAIAILVIGGMTIDTWGVFGTFGNAAVLFGAAFGAVFVIGRLPMNGRNPFFALIGLYRAINAPVTGRYQGRPIRFRRPRKVTHMTNVYLGELPGMDSAAALEPGLDLTAGQLPEHLRRRLLERSSGSVLDTEPADQAMGSPASGPLSGVQALLALVDEDAQSTNDDRRKVVR